MILNFNGYSLGSKLVDTLALSHEHDLELCSLWVVVDELCQLLVDLVLFHRNVHSDTLLKVNNILLESFNLTLRILQLLQQFQRCFISFIHFLLKL